MSCKILTLIMNECTVKGQLGNEVAGAIVGAGSEDENATITLTKCTIEGTVGNDFIGSAVGAGYICKNSSVLLDDVTVNVSLGTGCKGSGIGFGSSGTTLAMTIKSSRIHVVTDRGSMGAAFGGGYKAVDMTVSVADSNVVAIMGDNSTGAAIGSGYYQCFDWGSMFFKNTTIYARASQGDTQVGAAAIGGGASTEFVKSTIYMYGQVLSFDGCNVTAIGGYGSQVSGSGIGFGAYLLTDGPYDSELEVSIVNSGVETHGGVAEVGGREGAAIGGSGNNEEVIKRIVIEKSNITATAGKHDKDVTVFGLRSDQGLGCLTITESKIVSTSAGHSVTMKSFDFNNELKCILDQHHL